MAAKHGTRAPRRARSAPIGWPAIVGVAVGVVLDLALTRPGGPFYRGDLHQVNVDAAVSFLAAWVIFVLTLMAGWDLLLAVLDPDDPPLGFAPFRYPRWFRAVLARNRWFVLLAFLGGLWLGHQFWR